MQSVLKRFQAREQLSKQVEVRFLPGTMYAHYIAEDLQPNIDPGQRKRVADLTDAEKKDAEDNYHELTFTFGRLSGAEKQKWDLETMRSMRDGGIPTDSYLAYIKLKLSDKLKDAKHEPKDGSKPIIIGEKMFKELLDSMEVVELLDLKNAYIEALEADQRLAAGNGHISAKAGMTP